MRTITALAVVWALFTLGGGQGPRVSAATAEGPQTTEGVEEGEDGPATVSLEDAGLQTLWRLKLRLAFQEKVVRMWPLDEKLYCLTSRGKLIAIDARRGVPMWSYTVPANGEPIFMPTHPPVPVNVRIEQEGERKEKTFDAVVLNTMTRLIVLDRADGTEVRNLRLERPANSSCSSDGVNAYIGSVNGLYHAFTLEKGVLVWTRSTDGMISAPVVYSRGHVYVASEDATFYVTRVGPQSQAVWRYKFGGPVTAPFVVADNVCFVACRDSKLYALEAFTGDQLWPPFICRADLTTPPQLGRNLVFQYAEGDKFYAINTTNGAEMWSTPDGRLVLAAIGKDVYLLDRFRKLRIIDEESGKLKAAVSLWGMTVFAPNTTHPAIYGASDSGWVVCINQVSEGRLKPDMFLEK